MDKPIFIDSENLFIGPFDIPPRKDYKNPVNELTGEELPYCCLFHTSVFEDAKVRFDRFPNCCDPHRAMISKWWFKYISTKEDKAN
jgi:hypothetical protein